MNDVITKGNLISIKSVKPLDDFLLLIEFNTGELKVFDVKTLWNMPVYTPLKNKDLFNQVHIVFDYTIAWNEDIDMCPDSLYRDSIPYSEGVYNE